MKEELLLGAPKALLPYFCVLTLFLLLCPVMARGDAGMMNYCNIPPLPGTGVKPNLMLMLDNSASMYDPAYTNRVNYCFDDTYDNSLQYRGYFDQESLYKYTFKIAANRNEDGYFILAPGSETIASSSCNTAKTAFVCVNTSAGKVTTFLASGRFLNWLVTSKLDLEKQALTGGKVDTSGRLQSETRGCQGRRFVRMVPGLPITFAVRGPLPERMNFPSPPLPAESDYLYRAGYGGMTRIEIYPAAYNKSACLDAVQAWRVGTLDSLKAAAAQCAGNQFDPPPPLPPPDIPSRGKVFTEVMSDCFSYLVKKEPLSVDKTLVDEYCSLRINNKYLDNPLKVARGNGDEVCGSGQYHHVKSGSANTAGYLGQCYKGGDFSGNCLQTQLKDYCDGLLNPTLTDPSPTSHMAASDANVPGFIVEGGISNLGSISATMVARFAPLSPPRGLIQEFSSEINFGAMVFQDNGAGSECSDAPGSAIPCLKHCQLDAVKKECYQDSDCTSNVAGACVEDPRTDGGKVISLLGAPVGSHNVPAAPGPPATPAIPGSGLIYALDQVSATSWTPLSESFYDALQYFATGAGYETQPVCQRNNLLIVTDGASSADRAPALNQLLDQAWGRDGMPQSLRTPQDNGGATDPLPSKGSYNLDDLAWIARNKKISGIGPIAGNKDYLSTYVLYTGPPCGDPGADPSGYHADGSCVTQDEGVPEKMMQLTAAKGGGTFARVQKPDELEKAMRWMLLRIATGSGGEPAILSTGDGNGAVYLQEQFYPVKSFDGGTTSATWIGEMQSLWYYIDPFIGTLAGAGSAIREDTLGEGKLDLKNDRIVSLRHDPASNKSYAYLTADSNGDGIGEGAETRVEVDDLKSLWRAGRKLWERDLTTAPRNLFTPLLPGGSEFGGTGLMKLSFDAPDAARPYLNLLSGEPGAAKLIKFLHGYDFPGDGTMRSRTLSIGGIPAEASDPQSKGVGVWKLGDVVSSTPQVQSSIPLGGYHLAPPRGYSDLSYRWFTGLLEPTWPSPVSYKNRGMVYVGANDGMLHAIKLGKIEEGDSAAEKAKLEGTELGSEQWAFLPKNVLPYLKYLAHPKYPHLYYVDGKITLVDASIGDFAGPGCSRESYWDCPKITYLPDSTVPDPTKNTWRTVLIGAMGLGGASCKSGSGSRTECVPTPLADPLDADKGVGYSSYFALDVTDPERPSLLWEFSHPDLGYSTSGPAIVRIGSASDSAARNGRWFAVLGSGPTGSIESATKQFLGRSDQDLKFFVLDLRTGTLVKIIDTDIAGAFAGSMSGAGIDADKRQALGRNGNYQDDAIYVGYSKRSSATGPWDSGGVLRILTHESLEPDGSTPWTWSRVLDGIGPVTTSIARLQDRKNHNLWLYFGTGRYFFTGDDFTSVRSLYGVKEPCYLKVEVDEWMQDQILPTCTTAVSPGALVDQSTTEQPLDPDHPGWRIALDAAQGKVGAERVVTNPTAVTGGAVFFSTFKPNTEPCQLDLSYLWGVKYDTGGAIVDGELQGKALVRLATGSMQDTGLSGNLNDKGGRRSAPMMGKPGGIKLVSNSGLKPLKKIIHIQER